MPETADHERMMRLVEQLSPETRDRIAQRLDDSFHEITGTPPEGEADFLDWGESPSPSVLPVAPTSGSSIFDQLQEHMRLLEPRPPVASRLEVGAAVLDVLRATIPPAEPAPWGPSPMARLTGVPIVQNDELGPAGWRLLDSAGEILKSGTLGPRDWEV